MSIKYKSKVINISVQNRRANSYFRFFNGIAGILTDPDDRISLYTAKSIVNSNAFVHKNLTQYMSDITAARMIQVIVGLAVIGWQWVFAPTSTWFSYFITSPSGLKKMYNCIFVNQLYGICFFSIFYLKLIQGTSDEVHFNRVARILGLPTHSDMGSVQTISKIVDKISDLFSDRKYLGYKEQVVLVLKQIVSGISATTAKITIDTVLQYSLKHGKESISTLSNPAVYISDRDGFDFDDIDIQEQIQFIQVEKGKINKYIKKFINPKHKQLKKQKFMEIAEIKTPAGEVICLNKCKRRIKTQMGCYCESDCSRNVLLNGKNWCWVDPDKCKKGKYLDKYRGYTYDYCDNTKMSQNKKCFTGTGYKDCKTS